MPEFDLIRRLQEIIDRPDDHLSAGCVLGIGDDAAILDIPPGRQLAVCTDTLVEGVHFSAECDPRAVGHKALAVNLSDLAAMGADPAWFLMSLTLPEDDPAWLDAFARGMAELACETKTVLAGGDTTAGGLSITVTAAGLVPSGTALTRDGARPGDRIVVSGKPGRAALALRQQAEGREPNRDCRRALDYPAPRLALGTALRGLATACIDLSDGLAADLGHILERSGAGARLDLGGLPVDACFSELNDVERWTLQLVGGDDYELCFTVPEEKMRAVTSISQSLGIRLSEVGAITGKPGLVINQPDGARFEAEIAGYQHFARPDERRETF